jgi:lipid-A-disaccharide synthase
MTDIFLLAAEPSADKLGAPLVQALRQKAPHLSIEGVAGPRLRELGLTASVKMEDLQVIGFTDVAAALPRMVKLFYRIKNEILRLNPKAVICIDYPGFNIRLERSLRKSGYQGKLIHAVCPTVWAWGKGRIPIMAKNLDLLLTLFPFEKESFAHTPLPVTYIGHPLVAKVNAHTPYDNFHEHYRLDPDRKILALFPGSRKIAIERNFPIQLQAAQNLRASYPDLQIAVSLSHPERCDQIRSYAPTLPLIEPEHAYDLKKNSHLALATSGTINLELALFGIPTVVNYAIRPFDLFLAQKIFRINLPHYCIVNILMNKRVFPELYGPNLSVETLTKQAALLWKERAECLDGCRNMRELLGDADASDTATDAILACLDKAN